MEGYSGFKIDYKNRLASYSLQSVFSSGKRKREACAFPFPFFRYGLNRLEDVSAFMADFHARF